MTSPTRALDLEDAENGEATRVPTSSVPAARQTRRAWMIGLTAIIVGAVAVVWIREPGGRPDQPPPSAIRTLITVAPADQLRTDPLDQGIGEGRPSRTAMALSPDGKFLVFSAIRGSHQHLYLRPLTELEATPISGTEGASSPFFSPDGQWLGFWASSEATVSGGGLFKVKFPAGGPRAKIGDMPPNLLAFLGANWGSDGTIVFAGCGNAAVADFRRR